MIVINKTSNRDAALNTELLRGVTFNRENMGHKFVISCMRGGVLEPVSGTVTGYFMRSNNTTCRVEGTGFTGVDADGRAWIILPQDCYNVAGRFKLSIYVLHNGASECIYSCIGTVERSDVGEVIDSGVPLPSYDDIADKYNEMETARQACIDAAESINGAVRYDEAQSLTDTQKTQGRTNIGAAGESDVDDLKSAIDGINNTLTEGNDSSDYWQINAWYKDDGSHLGNNKRIRTKAGIITPAGLDYIVTSDSGVVFYVVFYTASGTYVPRDAYPFVSYADIKAIAPEGAEVFRLVAKTDPESTLTNIVSATGAKVHISHGVIGAIDNRLNALETVEDELVKFAPITGFATANGVLKNDGTIQSSSTLVIKKYPYSGGNVYLDGTASYDLAHGFCYVWFVANEAMMENGYIPVSSKPQTFNMQKLDVPTGTEEIWVGHSALALYESSAIDRYARGKISVIEEQMSGAVSVGSQWQGKTWYAYGTSITANNGHDGRITYVSYLAQMSGMNAVNKGIGGGGIGNLGGFSTGQVYNAICRTSDGKLNADLITLETGANDINAAGDIPLGTIYDTGTETLAGCLNDCIRYLQTNTTAQIVVMPSPVSIAQNITEASHQYYTWAAMVEEICRLNRVHFIRSDNNMGYAKLTASDANLYIRDNIHQTDLGAYIMAQNIWYQLRNVPLFYTEMPT